MRYFILRLYLHQFEKYRKNIKLQSSKQTYSHFLHPFRPPQNDLVTGTTKIFCEYLDPMINNIEATICHRQAQIETLNIIESITISPKSWNPWTSTKRKCMTGLPLLTLASFDHLVYYKEDKITWQFLTFPSLNNNLNNNETKLFLIILIWRTYLRHKNAEIHKRGLARMYLVVGWRIVNSSGHNIM